MRNVGEGASYFIVIPIVRIRIRNDLPIHPRHSCRADLIGVVLDVVVSRTGRQSIALGTVVVRRVKVTHSPFLHHKLLASILGFLDVWVKSLLGQISSAISMNRNHIESAAREVAVLDGGGEIRASASGDENVGAAFEIVLDRTGYFALPFH